VITPLRRSGMARVPYVTTVDSSWSSVMTSVRGLSVRDCLSSCLYSILGPKGACPDEARENEVDWQLPPSAACADMWSSRLVPEAIEPHRALLRREETGASEVLTFSDAGSTSIGESASWPGSSGSVPTIRDSPLCNCLMARKTIEVVGKQKLARSSYFID